MCFRPFVLFAALAIVPSHGLRAQAAASSLLESYRRASELIEAAVKAHGGREALDFAKHARVRVEGHDFHRNQSRRVAAPYDSTPRIVDLTSDASRLRFISEQTSGFPGGFVYTSRQVIDSSRATIINLRAGTYQRRTYTAGIPLYGDLFVMPQGYLLAAVETPARGTRRYLGRMRLTSGATVEAVTFYVPNAALTLGFDPATRRLRAVLSPAADPFRGDVAVETEFVDYRELNGVLLPTRQVTWRAGERIRDYRYTLASPVPAITDEMLATPATVTMAPPAGPSEPLRLLAPGVWAIQGGGSWGILVEMSDHLIVLDAAPGAAATISSRAATLAPGKPIRYVVPTHHHDDHFGGVRHYAATAGATTVTTAGNVDYFRRIMSAPVSTMLPPGQAAAQPGARLEVMKGKRRVFTDGTRTVEIHDIGPSPHANEMLIAWLPAEGILFQADLIEAPLGIAQKGANAETTMHLADFVRRQGWEVKVFGGVHGFLKDPGEFARLVQEPLLP